MPSGLHSRCWWFAESVLSSSRGTDQDFAKFVQIAIGSATEVEYHLEFAADAEIIPRQEYESRKRDIVEIRRMLSGLLRRLRQADRSPRQLSGS